MGPPLSPITLGFTARSQPQGKQDENTIKTTTEDQKSLFRKQNNIRQAIRLAHRPTAKTTEYPNQYQ